MDEKIFATIGNDPNAQETYFETFRRSEFLEPERALLLALLEDAIHCYRKFTGSRHRAQRRQFDEAEAWLMGSDGGLFAFENVCDFLGIDPAYLRRRLRESVAGPPAANRERRQRHSRHRQAA